MTNACQFSPCRAYRYTLVHTWAPAGQAIRRIMWIGLNPSTADENQLDPTLRRIRRFSEEHGFNTFVMTNLFAYRATKPSDMKKHPDPIGPRNDGWLLQAAMDSEMIVAAWGAHGNYRDRQREVKRLLIGHKLYCLGTNGDATPKHPLYLASITPLQPFSV